MNLKIICHDGAEYEVAVESYDANALNEQLNNIEINTVEIGGLVFSRIDVKRIVHLYLST